MFEAEKICNQCIYQTQWTSGGQSGAIAGMLSDSIPRDFMVGSQWFAKLI